MLQMINMDLPNLTISPYAAQNNRQRVFKQSDILSDLILRLYVYMFIETTCKCRLWDISLPDPEPSYLYVSKYNCDPFWHSESDVARAEYLVSPIMP